MISEKLDSVEENRGKKIYAVALTMRVDKDTNYEYRKYQIATTSPRVSR